MHEKIYVDFKYLMIVHRRLVTHLSKILIITKVEDWMRILLIIKDRKKSIVASNYRPIICLTLFKLPTDILATVILRYLFKSSLTKKVIFKIHKEQKINFWLIKWSEKKKERKKTRLNHLQGNQLTNGLDSLEKSLWLSSR